MIDAPVPVPQPAPDEKVAQAREGVFRRDLEEVINRHSRENGSGTPDFILADFLAGCLAQYDAAVTRREQWHGRATA